MLYHEIHNESNVKIEIIYEDNHLIAVFKPAGLLVQGDITGDPNLLDEVRQYLKEKYQKPGNVFVGLIHRLDRPVSGIVLFAKTSKGASRLSRQFRDNTIKKTYHALVLGKPRQGSATLEHQLLKDEAAKKAAVDPRGDLSVLHYETVSSNGTYSLLRIELETGRFHQIRAQLSAIGHAVMGDVKYGAPGSLSDGSIALCATELSFQTATSGESVTLSVPYPPVWDDWLN